MRTLVTALVGLALVAAPKVCAADHSKDHQRHANRYHQHARPSTDRTPKYPDSSGWYPHDADKLPFGSVIWWDQMRRERRLGGAN